jgi:DNA-binding MarR family transcriptional regulator
MVIKGSGQSTFPLGDTLDVLNLLWQTSREMDRISAQMEIRLGVSGTQRLIIRCIGKHPGISVGELAGVLRIEAASMSAMMKKLEERRLVERTRDPQDRRRVLLKLSPGGSTLDRATQATLEDVIQTLLAGTTSQEWSSVTTFLRRLAGSLSNVTSDILWRQRPAGTDTALRTP